MYVSKVIANKKNIYNQRLFIVVYLVVIETFVYVCKFILTHEVRNTNQSSKLFCIVH